MGCFCHVLWLLSVLLDSWDEAHLVAVRLSNDRLNHRRRDAEFRARGRQNTKLPTCSRLVGLSLLIQG